jgi:glycosyltransferase involved in cell wall biosynthesis
MKNFKDEQLHVLLISRLMPEKGIKDFLNISENLHNKKIKFTLVGPKSVGFDPLNNEVIYSHTKGLIDYRGELDIQAINLVLKESHIFLFPSYGEGMARVLLEAGFGRLCPIVYDISANKELINPNGGFIVPIGDIKKVISIINNLYLDREKLEINAINYQKHITEKYNTSVFTKNLDSIINSLFLRSN